MTIDVPATLSKLSLEEKIQLTAGVDLWRTVPLEKHGIPYAKLTDGPNGARGGGGFDDSVPAALFPSPSCLASTFDTNLARKMGEGIALDSLSKQCHVSLAPTVNCTRDQRYGRAFENYGEDPALSGVIGAAWVLGCQSVGVGATPKHFVCNEAEKDRRFSDSQVGEAALRELYLEPFRRIFKEVARAHKEGRDGEKGKIFAGQPACVMTAYNEINGTSASETKHTLLHILRKEWQWDGLIMSDWFALHDAALETTDLEMPGPTIWRKLEAIKGKVAQGSLDEQAINERAAKVLELLNKVAPLGFTSSPEKEDEKSILDEGREEIIRRIAAEGTVLLKNEGGLLPLSFGEGAPAIKKIALIGRPWKEPVQSGGGSANLTPQKAKPAIDSLREALDAQGVELVHHFGCDIHNFPREPTGPQSLPNGAELQYFSGRIAPGMDDDGDVSRPPIHAEKLDGDVSRPPIHAEKLDATSLMAIAPKPDECQPNDFSARLTFDLVAKTSGKHHLGLTCLGAIRLRVRREDGALALDWGYQAESDPFEYILNEYKSAKEKRLEMQAGERVSITISYSPAELDAQIAPAKLAGFRFGFDEDYDHEAALQEAADLASSADLAIVMTAAGKAWESEGFDRPDLQLPRLQNRLVEKVRAQQDKVVVVNVTGAAVEMPWAFASDAGADSLVPAAVQTWYGGQEAGLAIADVLLGRGDAPASGRMCTSWPKVLRDQPAGEEDALFPGRDSGRGHPDVHYKEGRLVGYKWYEAKSLTPAVWFGGGLGGYASFERTLRGVKGSLSKDGSGRVEVEVQVKNTSAKFSGKDVVQIYVALPESHVQGDVPKKKLGAFAAAHLKPGESTQLTLHLEQEDFSQWDGGTDGSWQILPGQYSIVLASSADPRDEIAREAWDIAEGWTWTGLGFI